jgi:hypothetical protein
VNLETNGERNVFNSNGVDLTPNGEAYVFDPKQSSKGWSIKCQAEGKVNYVKYRFVDGTVTTQYSNPFYVMGDGNGSWINKLDLFTDNPCVGDVKIDVTYHTWDGDDQYPCGSFTLKFKTPTFPPAITRCHVCRLCKNIRLYTADPKFVFPYDGTPQVRILGRRGAVSVPPKDLPVPTTSTLVAWEDYDKRAVADGSVETRGVNQCGATAWRKCSVGSPIALDLDRSGAVEHISGNFEFDLTGNGIKEELTEWFGPKEGILVDSNYTGFETGQLIGWHLFGDLEGTFNDGFEKLALHDFNHDGVVSGDELDGIVVWIDANSNAALDENELSTLDSHGVVSLSLSHDENYISSATLRDGTVIVTEDKWFKR